MGLYKKTTDQPPTKVQDPPKPNKKRKARRKEVQFTESVAVADQPPLTPAQRLFDQMFPGRLNGNYK